MNYLKNFWNFLKKDSWSSLVVTLIIAFILIKLVLFPTLSLITKTSLPLVIVESCSMYHQEYGFEEVLNSSRLYDQNDINLENTKNWPFQNGLKKGDVIFVTGAEKIKKGDVIIFFSEGSTAKYPIIHRVISTSPIGTKGDNIITNKEQLSKDDPINKNPNRIDEINISNDEIIGKALFRIPQIGWIKLIFFEHLRPQEYRGFCK